MSKHTPGPWRINPRAATSIISSSGRGIASAGGYFTNTEEPDRLESESIANARLISAAPDLLAALKLCKEQIYNPVYPEEAEHAKRIAESAIAKAEGRS